MIWACLADLHVAVVNSGIFSPLFVGIAAIKLGDVNAVGI
jgi:hypothetical protein